MKRLVFLLAASVALSLSAADLINKDGKKYELEISCGAGTTHTSINGNTTQNGAAKSGCTIKIKGGGSIKCTGKDIVIKNGSLSEA